MLSQFTAAATAFSLVILTSAQTTWPGQTYAIQGEFDGLRPWVYAVGSPLDVGINFVSVPATAGPLQIFEWFIRSADNATDPSTQVTIFNSFGGFAAPYGGHPLICGGQGMLLRTTFTAFPTVWDLTPLGDNQYKLSANVTTPNGGGKPSRVFWTVDGGTGLLPLDPEDSTTCSDSRGISQVFRLLPPSSLNLPA